jgi:hypothetical protein
VNEPVLKNGTVTICDIADMLVISYVSDSKKICPPPPPSLPKEQQKKNLVNTCSALEERSERDPEFLSQTITGDET